MSNKWSYDCNIIISSWFLLVFGLINFINSTLGDTKRINIRTTNKRTWQLNDTTFKTYSCVRVQQVIK